VLNTGNILINNYGKTSLSLMEKVDMNKNAILQLIIITMFILSNCRGKTSGSKMMDQPENKYAKTGSVDRFDPGLDEIITPGERPEILADGFSWTEGPLWLREQSILLFSDIPENSIFQWSEAEGKKLYLKPSGYTGSEPRGGESGSNGLLLDSQGRLVLCQHGDRRVARMNNSIDKPAADFTSLADSWEGHRLNSPNDAVYSSRGDLYFTDPAYGMENGFEDHRRELSFTGVYRLSANGELSLLTDKMTAPNGIALSPDETRLYVANSGKNALWMVYNLSPDGAIDEGKIFHDASPKREGDAGSPDGMKIRQDGTIFATGPGGVWIFSPEGDHLGLIRTGEKTSNCAIGNDGTYLYMTADHKIMRIRIKP